MTCNVFGGMLNLAQSILKTEELLVVRVSVGRLFQAAGPATLNAVTTWDEQCFLVG